MRARFDPGHFFKQSRRFEAARGATQLGKYQGQIVSILIVRQWCVLEATDVSETVRDTFTKLFGTKYRNNVRSALDDLLGRKILHRDDQGRYSLNLELGEWEGLDWSIFNMLYDSFRFLEGRTENSAPSPRIDKEPARTQSTPAMKTVQPCHENRALEPSVESDLHGKHGSPAMKTVQPCHENRAVSAGLENQEDMAPPKAPHCPKNSAPDDLPFDPEIPLAEEPGFGVDLGRWWVRAGIGFLALEKGRDLDLAREVAVGIASWSDRRGKGELDPACFAFAVESIASFWDQARDHIAYAIDAYKAAEARQMTSHPLLDRWGYMRGTFLYQPPLTASERDHEELLRAKQQRAKQAAAENAARARKTEQSHESKRDQAAERERQFEARRIDDLERAYRSQIRALSAVADDDLQTFADLFHPETSNAMRIWLDEGRPEPDSPEGMAKALDVLRGFDAEEVASKAREIALCDEVRDEIGKLSKCWRRLPIRELNAASGALETKARMAVRLLAMRHWDCEKIKSLVELEITRDALRELKGKVKEQELAL